MVGLNAAHFLASTSWLFELVFTGVCWPLVLATCIVQLAPVASLTRRSLRSSPWLSLVHFYQDTVAFFHLPSLVIDTDLDGLVTVRGVSFSILDLSLEFHGIEVGLDLGSGHEISIHTDSVVIKLFRNIAIDEIYGVHWFNGDVRDHSSIKAGATESREALSGAKPPQSKRELIKRRTFPRLEEASSAEAQDPSTNRILPKLQGDGPATAPLRSYGDQEAGKRYEDVLLRLRQTNRLYKSRERVNRAKGHSQDDHNAQMNDSPETRAAVCADLRNTRPPMSKPTGRISLSKTAAALEPVNRFLDKIPVVVRASVSRASLWLLGQSHPVACPAICFSAGGVYLGDDLLNNKLFSRYAAGDARIEQLKSEVTNWLSTADLYLDFANLRGHASVPLRLTSDIQCEVHLEQAHSKALSS